MADTSRTKTLRVLISTGHLGTAPSSPESFHAGMATNPDYVVADGGSSDPGPVYLGENITLGHFARDELELFLTESRKRGIPLIIGSAGDTGSNHGVDHFVSMIRELAAEHRIPKFKIGYFYSEVPKAYLKAKLDAGKAITGLGGFPALTADEIDQAARIVAVAGIHPFVELLNMGADVIIGGRCGDINFTAAPCIRAGFPEALAYHMGKMIECASLVAEPFMGKETIIGTISQDDIKITPYHPAQRCTVASAAGHSMYQRENPFYEHTLGGLLDMRHCRYEQFDARPAGSRARNGSRPRSCASRSRVRRRSASATWASSACATRMSCAASMTRSSGARARSRSASGTKNTSCSSTSSAATAF